MYKRQINYYHSNTQIITLEYYDEYYSVFTSDIVYITIEERKAAIIKRQKKDVYKRQALSMLVQPVCHSYQRTLKAM